MERLSAVHRAAHDGDVERLRAELRAEPTLIHGTDEHGKTALHWAAQGDRPACARLLLDAGADLEARSNWGASPFDWAATLGSSGVARLLLAEGATGLTLVTAAALGMLDDVVRWLEEGGDLSRHRRRDAPAEPDEYWPAGCAHLEGDLLGDALYAAARNGYTATVSELARRGARVDAKGVFGGTGLHWAAINGHAAAADLLLRLGADRSLRDHRFDATPAEWATEGGHSDLAERLRPGG